MEQLDLVLVTWQDGCNTSSWTMRENWVHQEPLMVHSVGYLYHEEHGLDGSLELVQNIADKEGENFQLCGRMTIPKRAIKEIVTLVEDAIDHGPPLDVVDSSE